VKHGGIQTGAALLNGRKMKSGGVRDKLDVIPARRRVGV